MIGDNISSNDSGVKSILGDPRNALIRMSIPLIVSLFFTSVGELLLLALCLCWLLALLLLVW